MKTKVSEEVASVKVKIMKIEVIPLKRNVNVDSIYHVSFSRGYKMPEVKEKFLIPNIKNAARGISMGSDLGYVYKFGDKTVFQVK